MKDLIGIAILAGGLWGGTVLGAKLLSTIRTVGLTKALQGLPSLSPFAAALTGSQVHKYHPKPGHAGSN